MLEDALEGVRGKEWENEAGLCERLYESVTRRPSVLSESRGDPNGTKIILVPGYVISIPRSSIARITVNCDRDAHYRRHSRYLLIQSVAHDFFPI